VGPELSIQSVDLHHPNRGGAGVGIAHEIAPDFQLLLIENRAVLQGAHGAGIVHPRNVSTDGPRGTFKGLKVIL
jgi:hypothetical protein